MAKDILYGICQLVDAGFQCLAGLVAALDELCHNSFSSNRK